VGKHVEIPKQPGASTYRDLPPTTPPVPKPATAAMQSPEASSPPVLLNIGGKKYATTVETLTQREPESMLAAMFSGRHMLPHHPTTGTVFVDRDGKHFRHVLNWLRDGAIPVMSESEYQQLLREAEYYQLLVKEKMAQFRLVFFKRLLFDSTVVHKVIVSALGLS